ncbi:hypothetical protein B5V89_02560 [Heyndrickxia sporothermodurans]|nr:hypothetical protein B5V89_02560 [Heyndrickxia sporothermodurans]
MLAKKHIGKGGLIMEKNKNEKSDQKIVLFPGLKDRLLEMGIAHLDNHQFTEAVDFLGQANEIDPENPEIGTAYLIALYESGNYEKAKEVCHYLLHQGIGNYFEIIDVYLMILIQLSNHEEIIHTISTLLDENEVPLEKIEHYKKLLQFSQNRSESNNLQFNQQANIPENPFFLSDNIKENIYKVAQLSNQNIHPYIDELTQYVRKKSAHPFLKTMILNVLKEHGVEKEIQVEKFNNEGTFIPVQLPQIFETPFYIVLLEKLKVGLENNNPTLYQQMKDIVDRHFFLLYPFELVPEDPILWCLTYRCFGQELYGETLDLEKIAEENQVNAASLVKAITFLKKLEEISLPII